VTSQSSPEHKRKIVRIFCHLLLSDLTAAKLPKILIVIYVPRRLSLAPHLRVTHVDFFVFADTDNRNNPAFGVPPITHGGQWAAAPLIYGGAF
jgi:hypothetical protein